MNKPPFATKLLRRKSAQELIDGASLSKVGLKKTLSVTDLIAFGIGATLGSGIFALTGTAAAGQPFQTYDRWSTPLMDCALNGALGRLGAGPAIVISFIVAAIACGFAALAYAELASMIPVSGSAYTFAYASLGQLVAWIIGWDLILEYAVGNIAVAISWSDYCIRFLHNVFGLKLPLWLSTDSASALALTHADNARSALYSSTTLPVFLGNTITLNLPAFFIITLITWVLVIGIGESALVNSIVVSVKLAVILLFVAVGAGHVHEQNWIPFAPNGWKGIMGGAAIVFFSFIGFDALSSVVEETKNPQKDLPLGMITTLIICTILYALVSLVLTGLMPYTKFANDAAPVASALASIGLGWAQSIVCLGALAGMTSVLLVFQLGQARIFMAMARDKLLPPLFAKLHPRYQTPVVPTICTGIFIGLFALSVDIGQAAELTNIGTLAAFVIVCGGVLVLRQLEPARRRPFHCPGVPLVPILGIVSCLSLMLSLPVITWLRFFGWMALGMVFYFNYGFKHAD